MPLHWMCPISVLLSKETYFCLYEVQAQVEEKVYDWEKHLFSTDWSKSLHRDSHTLPEESHKKHRQENKRWLKTCHSKEETQSLYPWVYLIVPDVVDIKKQTCKKKLEESIHWELPLAQTRQTSEVKDTTRSLPKSIDSPVWELHEGNRLRWPARDKRQTREKLVVFQEWRPRIITMNMDDSKFRKDLFGYNPHWHPWYYTRHQPRALDRMQKRVFNYLFRKLSKQGKEQ